MTAAKRTTVYFEAELHQILQRIAAETDRSISDLVNSAVRASLLEVAEDIDTFCERANESVVSFGRVLRYLRRRGRGVKGRD